MAKAKTGGGKGPKRRVMPVMGTSPRVPENANFQGPQVKQSGTDKGRAYPAGCDKTYTKKGNP